MDQECLVALGANLPFNGKSPVENCKAVVADLAASGFHIRRISRFFETPAFPAGHGPDYINAALALAWPGDARGALDRLHQVELRYARERGNRWGARTLDLDLLTFGHEIAPSHAMVDGWIRIPPQEQPNHTPDQLLLPHPRIQDRAFVLVPLCDIASDWYHPILKRTARQMRDALDPGDLASVKLV